MIRPAFLLLLAAIAAAPASAAERRFDVAGYDKVALAGSDDVVVRRGSNFTVVAAGDSAQLDQLEIKVENNTLKIGRKKGNWGWISKHVIVTVTLPALRGLALAGSGDIQADQGDGDVFDMKVAGSGDIVVGTVEARTVNVGISGSGDIKSAGRCGALNVRIAGSGDASLAELHCTNAAISIAGSGDVAIHATGAVAIRKAGSGNVTVTGGGRCTSKVAGSGSINC